MITQQLLNYIAQDLAFFWSSLPALPAGLNTVIGNIATAEEWLSSHLANLGVIIPWTELSALVGFFVAILGFWVIVQGVRVVLWIVNR